MKELSSLKAAWHLEKIQQLRDGKDIVPTHVQIILSDLCNQDCHFCAYRMEGGFSTANFADESGNKNPNRKIPTEKALEIVEDCHRLGVGALEFTGGGEPTVHPQWAQIIGRAQDLGMGTGLVTNAVLVKESHREVLERLTWLRISLDAGSAQTYDRIRKSNMWDRVLKNIKMIGELNGPLVGIGFVVTRENYAELEAACQIAKDCGIPYVRVSAMFGYGGANYYNGLLDQIDEQRQRSKALEDEKFKVIDFFGDRVKDLQKAAPTYKFCGEQQFVLYIGGDQKVYTCCTNAYTPWGEIGDLKNQTFADWMSNHRRYDFDARKCHHCQFNDKNEVINYMIGKPAHVDFV